MGSCPNVRKIETVSRFILTIRLHNKTNAKSIVHLYIFRLYILCINHHSFGVNIAKKRPYCSISESIIYFYTIIVGETWILYINIHRWYINRVQYARGNVYSMLILIKTNMRSKSLKITIKIYGDITRYKTISFRTKWF